MTGKEQRELEKHRREHFAIKVELINKRYSPGPGEVVFSVTHDGHHWQGVNLTHYEQLKAIQALIAECCNYKHSTK